MALRASLDALPNELLYEILEHLTKERDAAVPRRYQMLTTFASLNRRFRQFALPHSFKELRVPNHNRLPAMFEFFRHHLSLIRVLRVGNPILRRPSSPRPRPPHGWNPYCDQLLPGARQFVLLENLVNFDCVGFCFEPTELAEVFGASNSRLQSLRLGWDWRHLFPFEALPSLENLSIHVIARPNSGCWQKELSYYDPVHPCTFPSLTTLSIIDAFLWFDQTICGEVTFPALRKFHLLPRSPDCCVRILGFISDHPGLLEVDIPRMYLNFPDLINLAKSERKTSWHTRSTIRARGAPLSGAIIPDPIYDTDFMRWKGLELAGFSFIRAARKQPEDPADPVAPHKLTELSIQTSPDHESLLLQGIGALGRVPLLADCTRLSLVISDAHNEEDPDMESVESIINTLSMNLMHWSSLRYFYLCCTFPEYNGAPPMRDGRPLDCKSYFKECESEYGSEWVEDVRQDAADRGWECHDDACAMALWTEQHGLEGDVRYLAWACITLELFEWSMREPDFNVDGLSRGLCAYPPPLGRWRIYRNPDGSVRMVSGQVTWNGHPNHPPSSLGFEQFK